jgi:hypothetical protein
MAFVCTISDESFSTEVFINGSSTGCVINVGYDDTSDKGFSVVVGLETAPGGGHEFFFFLLEVDGGTGAEHPYWCGKDVAKFIGKDDRNQILRAILGVTEFILTEIKPKSVNYCTHDQNPPEEALVKHFLIANVFEECGYEVRTADPYHGKRIWWMELREA